MRRIFAVAIILCVSIAAIALALTYKMWGGGFLSGSLRVDASLRTPKADGSVTSDTITIGIWSGGRKIGQSGTEIQLTSGQYTISFENYSVEYQTPQEQIVSVKPYETTHLSVEYPAEFGYLRISARAYDAYGANYSNINAEIFVDAESKGFADTSQYGTPISIRLSVSESPHIVSFSMIDGYTRPESQTATVSNYNGTEIAGTYNKILTSYQEIYVFCRNSINQWHYELNATSQYDIDQFKQRIRDNRITTPEYYVVEYGRGTRSADITYYVARYGGIYEEDQVKAAMDIFYRLNSSGIDLRTSYSENKNHLMVRWGLEKIHYSNDAEYIVGAEVEFHTNELVNVEGNIYQFRNADIDALPNLSTSIQIEGVGFSFEQTRQVYVMTGSTTVPFENEYVPPFREYRGLIENQKGWSWHAEWGSGPYNPRELFRSLRIEIYV